MELTSLYVFPRVPLTTPASLSLRFLQLSRHWRMVSVFWKSSFVDLIIARLFSFVNSIFIFLFKNILFFCNNRFNFHNLQNYLTSRSKGDVFHACMKKHDFLTRPTPKSSHFYHSFSFHLSSSCAILTSAKAGKCRQRKVMTCVYLMPFLR